MQALREAMLKGGKDHRLCSMLKPLGAPVHERTIPDLGEAVDSVRQFTGYEVHNLGRVVERGSIGSVKRG